MSVHAPSKKGNSVCIDADHMKWLAINFRIGLGDFRIAGFGGATSSASEAGSLYNVQNGGRLSITGFFY